jgi:hypothetical protein
VNSFDHRVRDIQHGMFSRPSGMKRLCLSALLVAAIACGSKGATTSSSPMAPTLATFSVSGRVITSFTLIPISGATVSIRDGRDAGKYTTTDASGNFTFTELQESRFIVNVSASNYFSSSAPVTATSDQTQTFFLIPTGPGIVLTGLVTDAATSAPIPGASVSINGRYSTTTDASGRYSVTGFLDLPGDYNATHIFSNNYDNDTRYIRGTSQNVRLHRTERITAGDSKNMTLRQDDTLCYNDFQDPTFGGPTNVCRSVRVVAPSAGVMTVEAVSTQDGSHPPLVVETVNASTCCSEMGNPVSIPVTAGTEVVAYVGMASGSPTTQSFRLITSMAP